MAIITISEKISHSIDAGIYGQFIEEIGECIHDGIWAYSPVLKQLPMVDDHLLDHVRADVFDAAKDLVTREGAEQTVLRWPGGCFSDIYKWQDGVGHREQRPIRGNSFWNKGFMRFVRNRYGVAGPDYNNHFGTDEFLTLCEAMGVEPYININYGSGTPKEAADWVEYVNGAPYTKWGSERAKVHPEPYGVKYWGIANEIWGRYEPGYEKYATGYARRYIQFAKAMKERDPDIKLIACGTAKCDFGPLISNDSRHWNQKLLAGIEGFVDFLSIHIYQPKTLTMFGRTSDKFARNRKCARAILAGPATIRGEIQKAWKDIVTALGSDTNVRVCLDEWNLWYDMSQVIKGNNTLLDGLWVASVLHLFQELSPIVPMANIAQMVNVLGLIRTDDEGVVKTPSYHAFQLLRRHSHSNFAHTRVDCGTFKNKKLGVNIPPMESPLLDCSATVSEDGKQISLSIVNKDLDNAIPCAIKTEGDSRLIPQQGVILKHQDLFAKNTQKNRENIHPEEIPVKNISLDKFELPPHSFTILKYQKQD